MPSVSTPQRLFGVLLAAIGLYLASRAWLPPVTPDTLVRDAVAGPILLVAGLTCLVVPMVTLDGAPRGHPSVAPERHGARFWWAVSLVGAMLAGMAHLWLVQGVVGV